MDFVFLGFMAAMAVAGLVVGKLAGKKLGKAEFDGKAYKAGFYTLLAGLLAVYLIPIFTEWQPKDTALLLFAVICVGVTVFACVAVANDAYLGIRQNPRAMLLVLGIVVVGNLTAGFSVMESVGFADGLAVENSMNFIIAAMGLIILAALAIRLRMAARDEEQALAELCGVSRQTIVAIEKGDYNPTINLCRQICRALGKTLDELFWEDD